MRKPDARFTQRLMKAAAAAQLSNAELALWFDGMSESVMRTWLVDGRTPQGYRMPLAEKALGFLEAELKLTKPRLPLAGSIRQGDRKGHVAAIRKRYS